jgi:hypothetical protein
MQMSCCGGGLGVTPFYRGGGAGRRQLGRQPLMAPESGVLNGRGKQWEGEAVGLW